jgi:hypothetical protein
MSGEAVEVYAVLLPGLFVLAVLILPIPYVRDVAASLVSWFHSLRIGTTSFSVSPLTLIVVVTAALALQSYQKWVNAFDGPDVVPSIKTEAFLGQRDAVHASKWRAERNMYLHSLTFVTYISVLRIAQLLLQLKQRQPDTAAAQTKPKKE